MTSPDSAHPPADAVTAAHAHPVHQRRIGRLTHSGVDTSRFFGFHLRAAIFPMAAAAVLFGWRAIGMMAVVVAFAAAGTRLWQRIGLRGAQLRYPHVLWLATLLALTLPVHLFSDDPAGGMLLWPILPAAGLLIVIVTWALGGLATASIHPVVVAHLAGVAIVPLLHLALSRRAQPIPGLRKG